MSSTAAPTMATEKNEKAPKSSSTKAVVPPSHPSYFQMIKEALLALHERSGSSPYAIAKHMEEKHKTELPSNFKKILGLQLKKNVASGMLIKIKASSKLSESGNKEISEKKKKPQNPYVAEKKGVLIMNNARGAIMDTQAVADACSSGHIGGYGGDVWFPQPAPKDHPWRYMPNQAMTPHIYDTTIDAQLRYAAGVKDMLTRYFKGEDFPPENYIVKEVELASQYH